MQGEKFFVTQPLLPNISDVTNQIKEIWDSMRLTNNGSKHKELEAKLQDELKVEHVSLFNNGTIALLTTLKALDLPYLSEVITTLFTFAATPHCITWNGLKPVFATLNLTLYFSWS